MVTAILLLTYPLRAPEYVSQPANDDSREHASCSLYPPFVAPPHDVPTVLSGTTGVLGQQLHWRLFSPGISSFQQGDFWLSFDVASTNPARFEEVQFNITCYDPDDSDRSVDCFGSGLVSWILRDNGAFVQYMAFRNISYFFFNSTYPHIDFPSVDDEMIIIVSFVGVDSLYLFNITVKTETLFPEVEIISPVPVGTTGIRSLNSINRTFTVNASDPTGLDLSRLWGWYEDESAPETDLLLLAANYTPVSGVPHQLSLSLEALKDYAAITSQSMEHLLVNATLEVADLTDRATFVLFEFLFQNITASSTTTTTTNATTGDWPDLLFRTVGSALVIVIVVSVLILRSRTQHLGTEATTQST